MVTKISDFNLSNFIRFGPPVHYWCMHFEGKHSFFKDLAGQIKNFKNIAEFSPVSSHLDLLLFAVK